MKRKSIITVLAITTALGLLGTFNNKKRADELQGNILNQQAVLATLWQQDSAEVKALRFQAYQQARENIDQLIGSCEMPSNPAVILDIDETILDNIPAGAYQITSNHGYNHEEFVEWTSKGECEDIEGSVDFINYAQSKGVEIFLISNRSPEEMEATIANLQAVGVNVPQDHIMLKEDSSNKQKRMDKVEKDYNVIMYIGDNAGDFGGEYSKKSNEERSKIVMDNKDSMGVKYIALPNPTYGDFDGAIYGYDFSMSNDAKIKTRNEALKPFK